MSVDEPQAASSPEPKKGFWGGRFRLARNWISFLGFFLAALGLVLLATFFLFSIVSAQANPYLDIIGYLILPGVFVAGLLLVPVGMLWTLRRRRRWQRGHTTPLPQIDFNDRRTRSAIAAFAVVTIFVVLPVVGVTSYQGYHYTESTEFCGHACHSVMNPEATTHDNSPHARVTCAECHIGSGASWFVKSKLSGTRQVFAVLFDTYSRPIPPAITELRPARDTCEECHWPAMFHGSQFKELAHYSPDEQNTRRVVRLLLKTGGADESTGRVEGIHMHMLVSGMIEYVATDPVLQEIPWVRYVTAAGEEFIYRSDGKSAAAPRPEGIVRTVDCMDCHNRGAHHFRSPQRAVDLYLESKRISAALPYVKREAVHALVGDYPDTETAKTKIAEEMREFYTTQYPQIWAQRREDVDQAIEKVQELYAGNFFPDMRVNWQTYPENIGHLYSPGCFRCHDGEHVNQYGQAISSECDVCHTFLNPVEGRPDTWVRGGFQHSMNLLMHQKLRCTQCHTGGELMRCRDCHASGEWLSDWGKGRFNPTTSSQPGDN